MEIRTEFELNSKKYIFKPASLELNKYAFRLRSQLSKNLFAAKQGLDWTELEIWKEKLKELETAKAQIELILKEGKNSEGMLDEQGTEKYNKQLISLDERIEAHQKIYSESISLQSLAKLESELNEDALLELICDLEFLTPIIGKILIPNSIQKTDLNSKEGVRFLSEVFSNFFEYMKTSNTS